MALLVGTDFHPGIRGIGPKKAVALLEKEGGLEPILERLSADPDSAASAVEKALLAQHEALMDRDTIRSLFLEPAHEEAAVPEPRGPDGEAVRALMVDRFGFDRHRVDAALGRFQSAQAKASQQSLFDF